MTRKLHRIPALLLAAAMAFSLQGIGSIAVSAEEETVDLTGVTSFVFDGDTVTVTEGDDINYEVVVYDDTDNETTAETSTDSDGNTVYSLPSGSSGQLLVSIKKKGGSYAFSGTGNGSIAVKKEATKDAVLYLNGLDLTSALTAPITVKKDSTATCTIYAVEGTTNTLTDAEYNNADNYTDNEAAESAVIKGKASAQITLTGGGTLNLICNSKNAVKVGEYGSLTISELTLNVQSAGNGLSSDNTLEILSGTLTIIAEGDGVRTDPDAVDADTGCTGNITVSGGTITVTAGSDAFQAAQDLTITGGTFDLTTGSGYDDSTFDADTMSCKGLKASPPTETEDATNTITITGGTFTINTADDAIHSDGYIVITGGDFTISTGDDGVHADTSLTLGEEDGDNDALTMTIVTSYEGLEAGCVYIYSGTYDVTASDDGINAAGGSSDTDTEGNTTTDPSHGGGDSFNPGGMPGSPGNMGGWNTGSTSNSDYSLNVYGGVLTVNADGDGFDSNGDLTLTGGTITVWGGASGSADSPLDCDGTLTVNGATVFAAGSAGAAGIPNPSNSSQKYYVSTRTTVASGKVINVQYSGSIVYSTTAVKTVNYIFYSTPDMTSSSGYSISVTEASSDTDSYLAGDVNLDGTVTASDALLALQKAVGITELTGTQFLAADMDSSGTVTASDALTILQLAVS